MDFQNQISQLQNDSASRTAAIDQLNSENEQLKRSIAFNDEVIALHQEMNEKVSGIISKYSSEQQPAILEPNK